MAVPQYKWRPYKTGSTTLPILHPAGPGIDNNARFWSDLYRSFLSQHVQPGVLPARQAYLSVTEAESKLSGSFNSYDQYEVCHLVLVADGRQGAKGAKA